MVTRLQAGKRHRHGGAPRAQTSTQAHKSRRQASAGPPGDTHGFSAFRAVMRRSEGPQKPSGTTRSAGWFAASAGVAAFWVLARAAPR